MIVSVRRYPDSRKTHSIIVEEHVAESELWDSFRNGSREALNQIFEKYARHVFAYGKKITPDQALISDCIQDLFVELWLKRGILTPEIKSIKFYLIKSIRRRILRRLSADARVIGKPIPDEYNLRVQCNIESQMVDDQLSGEIRSCLENSLSALSESQREAVYLKFYENLSYDQIACIMNTNVKAVYNLISKSMISLRKTLKGHPVLRGQ